MTKIDYLDYMPTQLNRLFRLYAKRKNVSTENIQQASHKDSGPAKNNPNLPRTKKTSKISRRSKKRIGKK